MNYLYSLAAFSLFLLCTTIFWPTAGPDAQAATGQFSGTHLSPGTGNHGQLPALQEGNVDRRPDTGTFPRRLALNTGRAGQGTPESRDSEGKVGQIFDVTSARTLKIHFLGYKELTGVYNVNADATVSIPVLGRISVARMDTAELERILSKKVTSHTGRKGYATVEVMTYRPVFVTGSVKKPKSYDWVPGMTVLHAISLAGGIGTGNAAGLNLPLSTNTQKSRIEQASSNLKHLLAVLARLRAEKTGKDRIAVPKELVRLAGKKGARKLIDVQRKIYRNTSQYFRNQISLVKQARAAAKRELKAMKHHGRLVSKQIVLHRKHLALLQKLKKRKLVANTVLLELETKTVETRSKSVTARIAQERLQGRLLDLQHKLLTLTNRRNTLINKQVFKLEQDVAREKILLGTAHKAIGALNNNLSPSPIGSGRPKGQYQIVRESRKGTHKLVASYFTRLQPGDIVVISK